jgi:ATP-binding protein involved in chromosome partitioning
LDYLLIDMPPGSDRFETLMRLAPGLSGALVVTIPSHVSHLVVRRAITSAWRAGAHLLGLVENMAGWVEGEDQRELFPGGRGETFAAEVGIPYLGHVPFDPDLSRATDAGRPYVLEYSNTSTGRALLTLAIKLEEALKL